MKEIYVEDIIDYIKNKTNLSYEVINEILSLEEEYLKIQGIIEE